MPTPTILPAQLSDGPRIQAIAVAAGMFQADEAAFLGDMLAQAQDSEGPTAPRWLVAALEGETVGAAYVAPEPFADRMWNLYFIAVAPEHQSRGIGRALMRHVEETLTALGEETARTLVVETSSTDQYARTREFYRRLGYAQEARIRQFYGPDDDKVVFWRSLVGGKP